MRCSPVGEGYFYLCSLFVTIGSEVLYHDIAADELDAV